MNETMTARHALAHELHAIGGMYAQKAQTYANIAHTLDRLPEESPESVREVFPSGTPGEARDRATYAALCANFVHVAAMRVENGDFDWDLLQTLSEFLDDEAIAGDSHAPTAS